MLERTELEKTVERALSRSRGVVLVGPRQAGKSTLAQRFLDRDSPNYFDLEYPPHAQRLTQATGVLEGLQGRVVIDEIQRKPELFPLLRVLMDRSNVPGQFLLLGSASPSLLRQAGESLLGVLKPWKSGGLICKRPACKMVHGMQRLHKTCGYEADSRCRIWRIQTKTAWFGGITP